MPPSLPHRKLMTHHRGHVRRRGLPSMSVRAPSSVSSVKRPLFFSGLRAARVAAAVAASKRSETVGLASSHRRRQRRSLVVCVVFGVKEVLHRAAPRSHELALTHARERVLCEEKGKRQERISPPSTTTHLYKHKKCRRRRLSRRAIQSTSSLTLCRRYSRFPPTVTISVFLGKRV